MIIIPISDHPDQEKSLIMNDQRVSFRFIYNAQSDRWSMNVALDDEPVLYGRRVVTGIDILEPFNLGIGMIIAAGETEFDEPNRNGLPGESVLIYSLTEEEFEELLEA